ncbi:hypothetical protein GLOIN_2v1886689 [Rhizophagus clarus]|uniref:Uncharacterized protein n=1 Tax=Rhizophagus clarus TaxID=94130 RepID=A0A8H3QR87_9GLOM|nr:hypothetical protein GLOIN_2v1886689 [Rhizophagus clarus]
MSKQIVAPMECASGQNDTSASSNDLFSDESSLEEESLDSPMEIDFVKKKEPKTSGATFFFVKLFSYLFSQVQNTEVQNTKGPEAEFRKSNPEHRTCGLGFHFKGPELFRGRPVFRRTGTLFRGGPLSPELHRRTIKSGTPFRGGPLSPELL